MLPNLRLLTTVKHLLVSSNDIILQPYFDDDCPRFHDLTRWHRCTRVRSVTKSAIVEQLSYLLVSQNYTKNLISMIITYPWFRDVTRCHRRAKMKNVTESAIVVQRQTSAGVPKQPFLCDNYPRFRDVTRCHRCARASARG